MAPGPVSQTATNPTSKTGMTAATRFPARPTVSPPMTSNPLPSRNPAPRITSPSVSERHEAVRHLDELGQVSQAGDLHVGNGDLGGNAAVGRIGHAGHQRDPPGPQLRPALADHPLSGGVHEPIHVVHAVGVEEDADDLVPAGESGLDELPGAVRGLVLVRPLLDHHPDLHRLLLPSPPSSSPPGGGGRGGGGGPGPPLPRRLGPGGPAPPPPPRPPRTH